MIFVGVGLLVALTQDPLVLRPGAPLRGQLHTISLRRQDFEVEVPEGSVFLKVRAMSSDGDIDLFGGLGDAPDDPYTDDFTSVSDLGFEELILDRLSEPAISPGTWWFSVVAGDDDPLGSGDPKRPTLDYSIELTLLSTRTDAVLTPGVVHSFALDSKSGGFRTLRVNVPEGSEALRVDLQRVPANLDLFMRRESPMTSLETAHARARHGWGAETLLLTPSSRPKLLAGAWYIDVIDVASANVNTPFDIRVAFSTEPTPEWNTPPRFPVRDPAKPLSRGLNAVLEVFTEQGGGSATLITPDGLALTNAHVVDRGDRQPAAEVILAANLDSRRPPQESFRGTVVRFDADLDLALIQVQHSFYGAPLPQEYRFPTVEFAPQDELEVGDALWVVGYPLLGGTGSRVSIHAAHGVLSGFTQEQAGLLFKTDASVISGNSGGAALDARGRLVGIPSANVSDGTGLVGLITPIAMVPAEWKSLIRSRQP